MIFLRERQLIFTNRENYIGTPYDDNSENRIIEMDRVSGNGVDLASLTFRMDLKYKNGGKDTCILEKEIHEDKILLMWKIENNMLQVPGTMFINIRAFDEEGYVKYSSFQAAVYVEPIINTSGSYTGKLTELEQLEIRIENKIGEIGNSAEKALEAAGTANTATEKANAAAKTANEAATNSDTATEKANAAAENASAIRDDIMKRLEAGEFKGEKGEQGEQGETGPQGASGVTAPASGMFSLHLDPATGNLYVDYPDNETAPAFQYDEATGNLYYLTGEDENG